MPLEDAVTRGECARIEDENRTAINRVHSRIDAVEKTTSSIETSANAMNISTSRMERILFGDEKCEGVLTKISNMNQRLNSVYWIGGTVMSTVVIAFIGALMALVLKK